MKYAGKVFCLSPVKVWSKGCSDQWKFFWDKFFPFLHFICFLIWRFCFNVLKQILRRLYHLSTNITCARHYRWQGLKHSWNQCLQWNLFAWDSMMWPEIMSSNRDYHGNKLNVGHISWSIKLYLQRVSGTHHLKMPQYPTVLPVCCFVAWISTVLCLKVKIVYKGILY